MPQRGLSSGEETDTEKCASEPHHLHLVIFAALSRVFQVFLSRLFLVALLERRNDILARSVRDACAEAADGTAVVAILGAAHLNGIQQRLIEEEPLEGVVGGVKAADVAT